MRFLNEEEKVAGYDTAVSIICCRLIVQGVLTSPATNGIQLSPTANFQVSFVIKGEIWDPRMNLDNAAFRQACVLS